MEYIEANTTKTGGFKWEGVSAALLGKRTTLECQNRSVIVVDIVAILAVT